MGAYQHIVILTGAGISAESGLATFRDSGGLWEQHRIEEVATPEAFERDPALVYRFYNARRAQLTQAEPGAAHRALAHLQKNHRGRVTLITQNVDNLHERGGAQAVIHMHGELMAARCAACHSILDWSGDFDGETACPSCSIFALRPHIVWFGEMPLFMDDIADALATADLFVAIGTSGQVYPAAGFVDEIRRLGQAHSIEINLEASERTSRFHEHRRGPASQRVPELVQELLVKTGGAV